jgi:acetylornithine deacetylase
MVFMEGIPAVKCGPGKSERSHTPDEYVLESEILEGARFYTRLVRAYAELREREEAA